MSDGPDTLSTVDRPLIIPFFIPHMGCPHQCIFCNQRTIAGDAAAPLSVHRINTEVRRYLKFARKRYTSRQISFFGGNFLGLEEMTVRRLLTAAAAFVDRGQVDSLRFSTRPDTIRESTLSVVTPFPVRTVELGVQSMNDSVLHAANRGHRAVDTIAAVANLKTQGYQVGLQMMVGLPGDDDAGATDTARRIADLEPDFVRIYPTLVLSGSLLAERFRTGAYHPMHLDRCVTLVKRLFLLFKARGIPVIRMGLQASDGLADHTAMLAGPYHPAFGHLVHGEIVRDAICRVLDDAAAPPAPLCIATHPTMVSRVQGLNKRNVRYFRNHYGIRDITIVQDATLTPDSLIVNDHQVPLDT